MTTTEPFDLDASVDGLLRAGVSVPLFGPLVAAFERVRDERDAALAAVQAVRDELDEKHRAELAKEGQRWAAKAEELYDALGVIMDICEHATPIAYDADGFVAAGYTVTVGAIHRALAYLQGALHKPPEKTAQTWAEFQAWLVDERERALGTVGQPQEDPSE